MVNPTQNKGFVTTDDGFTNTFALEPMVYVDAENTAGWTKYAEKLNGRLAMVGFIALIVTELIGGDTLINLVFQL